MRCALNSAVQSSGAWQAVIVFEGFRLAARDRHLASQKK